MRSLISSIVAAKLLYWGERQMKIFLQTDLSVKFSSRLLIWFTNSMTLKIYSFKVSYSFNFKFWKSLLKVKIFTVLTLLEPWNSIFQNLSCIFRNCCNDYSWKNLVADGLFNQIESLHIFFFLFSFFFTSTDAQTLPSPFSRTIPFFVIFHKSCEQW